VKTKLLKNLGFDMEKTLLNFICLKIYVSSLSHAYKAYMYDLSKWP